YVSCPFLHDALPIYRADVDVRGVNPVAVACDGEHMGLDLAGGQRADNRVRLGIDDGHGLCEFRRDVEPAVRAEFGTVRPSRLVEMNRPNDFARGDVNDVNRLHIRPGTAHAGVSVNRRVDGSAVGGGVDFVRRAAGFVGGVDVAAEHSLWRADSTCEGFFASLLVTAMGTFSAAWLTLAELAAPARAGRPGGPVTPPIRRGRVPRTLRRGIVHANTRTNRFRSH